MTPAIKENERQDKNQNQKQQALITTKAQCLSILNKL